ncbi:helix-turn-helix transcriptional regulator [Providencia stuartii]|uniref:Cro/Cl family transcriptional regulator n=3 Tax=Enterobacterales TaxID=91347 RepID=A0A1S1HUG6_PROST|nr:MULTISPECIES: helix-turn-helix transcriptional regulator [Morganellaceae]MDV5226148.1 helix-turn-helix transcriptional regulator [Providencia rettgeri]ELR5042008.1 helix-turn-helix transcriptional regulator [Providencia stuartii]ELR5083603.1 helix-turn-helix transcriptional regulator [Providencia stuartii]ELR5112338.1 helix-turn-helix transcriptional regulator [Providencia stuartii]ELR5302081.1 helix-turn-helix transcriptional regulator [Providencia stuartii]
MPIIITLDVLMVEKKIKSKDLALELGITEANLSLLKNGKIKGIKFSTLEKLCEILDCQPGDIIKYT